MKTKKILAILLSMVMMMSLGTVAMAGGDRVETSILDKGIEDFSSGVFDADDGTYGTRGFFGTGSGGSSSNNYTASPDSYTTLSIGNETGRGNFAKVNTTVGATTATSSSGTYAARMVFDDTIAQGATSAFGVEYMFRLPSTKTDLSANPTTSKISVIISDNIQRRNRTTVMQVKQYSSKWGFYIGSTNTAITTMATDTWYKVKIEYIVLNSVGRYRITIFDAVGNYLASSVSSDSSYYPLQAYGTLSFGENTAGAEFHIDDIRGYSFQTDNYNYGHTLNRETWSGLETLDDSTYTYAWSAARCTFATDGASTSFSADKRVNAVTDAGSTDKYLRVMSNVFGPGERIEIDKEVSTVLTAMDNTTTSYPSALVYSAKVRIDDTSKDNAIELWVREHTTRIQDRIFTIEPDIGYVTMGTSTPGLVMQSDVWHELKLYHNISTGYARLEITNLVTCDTQIFEGKYTSSTIDSSNLMSYGFVTRFAEANTVDYDDLSVTAWNPNADSMAKSHTFGALTLSEEEIKAGEIKATVPVTSHCANSNVVTEVANLVMVSYDGNRLADISFVSVKPNSGVAEATVTIPEENAENYKVKAMLWDKHMQPLADWVGLGW